MRKPSKMVPRADLETQIRTRDMNQYALDAVLNHESEFPIRVKSKDCGMLESMKYTFRFVPRRFETLVIVTFDTLGQRPQSTVYSVEEETDQCRKRLDSDWSRLWFAALHARVERKGREVAA